MTEKRNNDLNVPTLRFPGFEDEWKRKKIKDLLKIGSGRDYKHLQKGDVPVYGTGGYMTSVNQYLHDGETICIGRKGTINKPFYYKGEIWTVDTLFYTHSFNGLTPRFGFNLFEKINWLHYNEASGVPSLSKSTIENIEVDIPNEAEQTKIAAFLEKIDERIATQNKIIKELKLLKSTLCNLLFQGKNSLTKEKWRSVELSKIFNIPVKNKPAVIDPEKLLTVKLHMKGVYKNENSETLSIGSTIYYVREKGQFIYGKQNLHNGALGIIPTELDGFLSSSDVPALDINTTLANKDFILYLIGQAKFYRKLEDIASGSGSKRIHESTLLKVKIVLPSIEEQNYIADTINSVIRKIGNEESILNCLKNQKSYLLKHLFSK